MNVADHPPDLTRPRRFRDAFYLLLFCLLGAITLVACGKAKENPLPPGTPVLALGDSLTAGAGVDRNEAWPGLLASRTGWSVINAGVSGDTSSAALWRLPGLLEAHKPVLVLVLLGGNDMLRRIPEAETRANLSRILVLIQERDAKAVLLATPRPSIAGAVFHNLSMPDFYREVADEHQVPLIEEAVADVLSDPQLKGDALHPNAAGHLLLAEKVLAALKSIGYAR